MHFALVDIISVSVVGVIAVGFLARLFFRMRTDKCVTVCSGCSGGSCSTKSFATTNKTIPIHQL